MNSLYLLIIMTISSGLFEICESRTEKDHSTDKKESIALEKQLHEKNASFAKFMNLFFERSLPLQIEEASLIEYDKRKPDPTGKTRYVQTRYRLIPDSLLAFIPDAKSSKTVWYVAIYKISFPKKFHTIIYSRRDLGEDGLWGSSFWMYLCTYSLSGELIDRMALSGYKHDNLEQSVSISQSFLIEVSRYEVLPNQPKSIPHVSPQGWDTRSKYQLSDSGKIICLSKKRRKVSYGSREDKITPFVPVPCDKP